MTELQKKKCEGCVWRCGTGTDQVLCFFPKCRRVAYRRFFKKQEKRISTPEGAPVRNARERAADDRPYEECGERADDDRLYMGEQ